MTEKHLKVLLVEDNPDDVRIVRMALADARGASFALHRVDCLAAAMDAQASDPSDVLLLDLGLPDCCGLEALSLIRQHYAEVPVVVLTGGSDDAIGVNAIARGAQDYLDKNEIAPGSLQRVLRYAFQRQQMLVQLQNANEQLDQKNRRLAQLYETAHQFVDHVSHEFRTPLTVIKEFVTIMRDGLAGQVSERQREFLEIVNDRTDDLAVIVDDMLDVSKLEAGLLSAWRKQANLSDILDHVRPTLQRKAAIKKVALEIGSTEECPTLFCDPDKIGRVIVNLVVNAIKFCGDDGLVKLWARPSADATEVEIGVTDNGPGIAEHNLQLIFDRFHQLEPTSRSSTKGFGLGLSIAKELVGLNLGTIEVESEPDQGSTFRFTVPAWDPEGLARRCLLQIERRQSTPAYATLLSAAIAPAGDEGTSMVVDEFLQYVFRGTDLVIRAQPNQWLILTRCCEEEVDATLDRVRGTWDEANRNRPGGLLPPIRYRVIGTWRVETHGEEIRKRFLDEMPTTCDQPAQPRVLVVDDDTEMLRGLKIRLSSFGYDVLTATDGKAAIEVASRENPDVILMDNYMPGMDGLEAMICLGQQAETMAIPVIMISASLRDERKAFDHGARFFFQKPCDLKVLLAALRSVIAEPFPKEACAE